ncbi:hypothetical protein Tco_0475854, partial [Tanacetum coccineum]
MFQYFRYSDTARPSWSDEVLKLKNFKKDDYTIFQDQEKYEHVGPKVTSTQEGKISKDDDKRLCLDDDLKKLKDHIQNKPKGTSSSLKSKDHYIIERIATYAYDVNLHDNGTALLILKLPCNDAFKPANDSITSVVELVRFKLLKHSETLSLMLISDSDICSVIIPNGYDWKFGTGNI